MASISKFAGTAQPASINTNASTSANNTPVYQGPSIIADSVEQSEVAAAISGETTENAGIIGPSVSAAGAAGSYTPSSPSGSGGDIVGGLSGPTAAGSAGSFKAASASEGDVLGVGGPSAAGLSGGVGIQAPLQEDTFTASSITK